MPTDKDRDLTVEEHAVLGVLVTGEPCDLRQLRRAVEQRHGDLFSLDERKLESILKQLHARGLIYARIEP